MDRSNRVSGYRPELDGIRSIAILAVLGFHVGFSDWSGGFLGVDVFFVLSGWLICGHIHDALRSGQFNPWTFFARRIRRLIPAAFACYLIVTLVVLALFLPFEQEAYLRYLLGSAFFFNNFVLMSEAGYFASEAGLNPLLHTWSLSIEEQFYLVVPWLALLIRRSARAFAVLLAVAVVVSLGLTIFSGQAIHDDDARYFSSLFRTWEIAAGGLAYVMTRGRDLPRFPGLALLALMAVLAPIFVFDETLLHPGSGVTVVVAETLGLILLARPDRSLVGRMLASRPMAFIGRISYSTYLWHWPLIVFLGYVGHDFSDATRALTILGSLGFGYLSYRVIEAPVRSWGVPARGRALFMLFTAQSAAMLGLAAVLIMLSAGRDDGSGSRIAGILEAGKVGNEQWESCWYDPAAPESCRFGQIGGSGRPLVLWGDSMASSAVSAFDVLARERQAQGMAFVIPSCAPLLGLAHENANEADCLAANDAVLGWLQAQLASDVFLFARWPMYFEGYQHTDLDSFGSAKYFGPGVVAVEGAPHDIAEQALRATLAAIPKHHRVIVVGPVPEYRWAVPDAMVRAIRFGSTPETLTRAEFDRISLKTRARLADLVEAEGAVFIDPADTFCTIDFCPYAEGDVPIFADAVHLAILGNKLLSQAIERYFLDAN
ncbi:MAG: acyltransferase family protein [Rhodobacteraceae bacterium]|nr:acyltransferase family protein [Paracoccaceae bacterium]